MTYLLDTNVISETVNFDTKWEVQSVRAWFDSVDIQELWISVVTLSELEVGVSRKEAKGEGKRLREWLRTTEKIFDGRIHDFRRSQVPLIGSMHPPHLRSMDFDELIAATALEYQHTIVTRNVKHFTRLRVEIPVINPWDYEAP